MAESRTEAALAAGRAEGLRLALERGDRERDALKEELAQARAELADARRPLLLRLVEALRRGR